MKPGLLALAVGGFGIGLTEFVIAGLLPEVAADFAVSEATAGWLISGYALSVAVGAIGLTAGVTRLPRKPVLLGLMQWGDRFIRQGPPPTVYEHDCGEQLHVKSVCAHCGEPIASKGLHAVRVGAVR